MKKQVSSKEQGASLEQGASNGGQKLEVIVAGDEGSNRLDRALAMRCPELSRSRLKALILAGQVTVKNAPIRDPAYHVACAWAKGATTASLKKRERCA